MVEECSDSGCIEPPPRDTCRTSSHRWRCLPAVPAISICENALTAVTSQKLVQHSTRKHTKLYGIAFKVPRALPTWSNLRPAQVVLLRQHLAPPPLPALLQSVQHKLIQFPVQCGNKNRLALDPARPHDPSRTMRTVQPTWQRRHRLRHPSAHTLHSVFSYHY